MDQASITATLDQALLTDAEMLLGPDAWRDLPDPFPKWAHNDPSALDANDEPDGEPDSESEGELENQLELERAG